MDWIRVKPASGLVVRDPATKKPIPAEGARVQKCAYWNRRLKDGSVVIVGAEKRIEKKPDKPEKPEKKPSEAQKPSGKAGE